MRSSNVNRIGRGAVLLAAMLAILSFPLAAGAQAPYDRPLPTDPITPDEARFFGEQIVWAVEQTKSIHSIAAAIDTDAVREKFFRGLTLPDSVRETATDQQLRSDLTSLILQQLNNHGHLICVGVRTVDGQPRPVIELIAPAQWHYLEVCLDRKADGNLRITDFVWYWQCRPATEEVRESLLPYVINDLPAQQLSPRDLAIVHNLTVIQRSKSQFQHGQYAAALKSQRQLPPQLQNNPSFAIKLIQLGQKLEDVTLVDEAVDKLHALLPQHPGPDFLAAVAYRDLKAYDKTLAALDRLALTFPGDPHLAYQRAYIYEQLGDYETARSHNRVCLELLPEVSVHRFQELTILAGLEDHQALLDAVIRLKKTTGVNLDVLQEDPRFAAFFQSPPYLQWAGLAPQPDPADADADASPQPDNPADARPVSPADARTLAELLQFSGAGRNPQPFINALGVEVIRHRLENQWPVPDEIQDELAQMDITGYMLKGMPDLLEAGHTYKLVGYIDDDGETCPVFRVASISEWNYLQLRLAATPQGQPKIVDTFWFGRGRWSFDDLHDDWMVKLTVADFGLIQKLSDRDRDLVRNLTTLQNYYKKLAMNPDVPAEDDYHALPPTLRRESDVLWQRLQNAVQCKDFQALEQALAIVREDNPNHPYPDYLAAVIYRQAEEYDKALEALNRLRNIFPDDSSINAQRCLIYFEQDNHLSAVASIDRAIAQEPANPHPYVQKLILMFRIKDHPGSLAMLRELRYRFGADMGNLKDWEDADDFLASNEYIEWMRERRQWLKDTSAPR